MSTPQIILGKKGESLVAKYLEQKGFNIRAMNFQIKEGEIDIIAQKSDTIAFVEVKLRANPLFPLAELINKSKQRKIIKTALNYIAKNSLAENVIRFDVALVEKNYQDYNITYIDNAFTKE